MSGSGVQLPKWKSYTLPSWEQPTIYRDPPKSIHTRKKERVDMSNVTYMIRNDDSRINEGVAYLQRGINPHIDIMYNNVGGGGGGRTTTMPNVQASNPYKIMKDGAFRPPMFKQEDLLPLSRQRRPETSAITNPGIRSGYNIHNLVDMIDKEEVSNSINVQKINYLSIRPTAMYKIELPTEMFTANAINENVLHTTVSSSVKGMDKISRIATNEPYQSLKNPLHSSVSSNSSILSNKSRDETIDKGHYINDKSNYTVQSSAGRDNLVYKNNNKYNVELSRNMPLYNINSSVNGNTKDIRMHTNAPKTNEKLINTSASSSVSMNCGRQDAVHDTQKNIILRGMGSVGNGIQNVGFVPTVQKHNIPTINNKGLTIKQIAAKEMGNRYN